MSQAKTLKMTRTGTRTRRSSQRLAVDLVESHEPLDLHGAVRRYVDMCISEIGLAALGVPNRAA